MAILTRKTMKVFAAAAADIGQFGSGQLGTKVITTDPAVVMNASAGAAWAGGWLLAVLGANKFPPLEEMNGIAFVNTYQLAYLFQEGVAEYDAATTYYQHSVVKKSGTYQLYGSVTNANIGNALTDPTNWLLLGDLSNLNSGNSFKSIKITQFTGSGTWTVDTNNVFSIVKGVAGGGGSAGTTQSGSPGGGSGGYLEFLLTKAQASTSQAITIGAAGAAGSAGPGNGGTGGTTSIGSLASVTGGAGSVVVPTGASDSQWAAGGVGGVPTVTTGTDIGSKPGEQGGSGGHAFTNTGGIGIGGYGGGNPLGEGGSQVFAGNAPGNANSATLGTGFGVGGGGVADLSGASVAGVAGLIGKVTIMEFLSV